MRRRNLVIVALIIVGVLIASGVLPILEITVNTNGVAYYNKGMEGNSNANGGGDLLDSTSYVTSWTGGGASEKIVIQAKVRFPDKGFWGSPLSSSFVRYWYVVKIDGNNPNVKINGVTGTTWTSAKMDPGSASVTGSSWFAMNTAILTLTNPCSGKVSVEFWGHHHWLNLLIPAEDDNIFATDQAYLRSGVGSVKVQNDVVEEGTDASFFVETGYAHSNKAGVPSTDQGWILNIYNPIGTSVFTKTIGDNFAGTVKWAVPQGSYSAQSTNIFRVVLRNELINQDDDWFFTVGPGMLTQIPNKPTFELVKGDEPFQVGEQVTIRISANKTYNDITGFWVWLSYETSAGTTTHYVYEKAWFPATKSAGTMYFADVTFIFPDSGYARLEASTADTRNLNSGMSELKFTVQGLQPPGTVFTPTDYSMLIVGVFIILLAVILYMKAPIPKPYNLVLALALVALAIYLMYPTLQTVFGG
jgi:hypothetical protein